MFLMRLTSAVREETRCMSCNEACILHLDAHTAAPAAHRSEKKYAVARTCVLRRMHYCFKDLLALILARI